MRTKLFISHTLDYSDAYMSLVALLRSREHFRWTNCSEPQAAAFRHHSIVEIRDELRDQIRAAQCVIILGEMWVNYSDWVQFELDFSKSIGKPILGVRPKDRKEMPIAVMAKSDMIVEWNADSIVNGIRAIK
ncbi:nuclease [Rhodobacterales bacterium HKCCE3408]|nr:nuclease [Rhodobacterales bacterium HKCCE3408]